MMMIVVVIVVLVVTMIISRAIQQGRADIYLYYHVHRLRLDLHHRCELVIFWMSVTLHVAATASAI